MYVLHDAIVTCNPQRARRWCLRGTPEASAQIPHDAKPILRLTHARTVFEARRAEHVIAAFAPGAAANHAHIAAGTVPCMTVRGRALVGVVPAVGGPFPNAAVHIVQAERIRRERSDALRSFLVPRIAAILAIGGAFAHLFAPPVRGGGAAANRVFPFGFGRQTV